MTDSSTTSPALTELLKDSPTNWGKWGDDDEVGALNYLGAEQVLAAVRLVSAGKVFTLQRLIGDPKGDPVWPGRTPAVRTQVLDESDWDEGGKGAAFPGGLHYADDKIDAYLQGSTQYDALGHLWYDGKPTAAIGIDWPIAAPQLSPRDAGAPTLEAVSSRLPSYDG